MVSGTHDGVLVVRVSEPAYGGRANAAALHACALALGVPDGSVSLLHGATSRRKLIGVRLPSHSAAILSRRLAILRST